VSLTSNVMHRGSMEQHYLHSSFREKLIEHLFIGELLKISWLHGSCTFELAKPEVDNQGYDLIAEDKGTVRHIQLKTAHLTAKASSQKIHTALSNKPSGCIVWIYFNEETLKLGPFLFFGSPAGMPLPDVSEFKIAKHTKANANGDKSERPAIRVVKKGLFKRYETITELYRVLFERA
jgi:hypothetical protein